MDTKPSLATGTLNPDRLIAGHYPLVTEEVTVASSAALIRGSVLGQVTSGGAYLLSASAAADGSESPSAILAEDVDASEGAVTGLVYLAGEFNENRLTFGDGHDADSVRVALRDKNIYLKKPVAA